MGRSRNSRRTAGALLYRHLGSQGQLAWLLDTNLGRGPPRQAPSARGDRNRRFIVPREPNTGTKYDYRASVQVKLREKPETYANVAAVHCHKTGARLHCLAADESRENFWLRRSGADLQLQLTAAGEGIEVIPAQHSNGLRSDPPAKSGISTVHHAASAIGVLCTLNAALA